MTLTVAYSASGDGYLSSIHSTYSGMYNGTSVSAVTGTNAGYYGRNNNSSNYQGFQTFLTFTYSAIASTEIVTAAYVRLRTSSMLATGLNRAIYLSSYSYGTLGTSDWRTPAQHAALPLYVEIEKVNGSTNKYMYGGSDALAAAVKAGTTIELAAMASAQYSGTAPTQDEGASFYLSENTGTASDPALIFTTVSRSRLNHVLGACVQLTDGSWAYLESDAATTPTITLKHCTTAGSVTTIATLPTGTGGLEFYVSGTSGAQAIALCIDGSNNLYVVGKVGNAENSLAAKAYTKGGGYTWSAQTTRSWPLVAYDSQINGCAAVYHSAGGEVLMCVFGHSPGEGLGSTEAANELAYALLDAAFLRTGSGSLMNDHGSIYDTGMQSPALASLIFNAYGNETGAGLDVATPTGGNADWGFVISFTKEQNLGDNTQLRPGRYIVAGSGTSFTHGSVEDAGYGQKDAGAKVRAIPVSTSTVAYVTTDADTGWGITICVLQYSGTNPGGVELAYETLADNSITNMPDGPSVATASWWDAIYNSVSNTLIVYYRDSANARIVRRTTFNLTTMLPSNDSIVVHTLASGTASIQAIRVARNTSAGTQGLVQLAVLDGGVYSLTNVIDTFNLAPTAPTLTPKSNFDATASTLFAWTFNDPNVGDTQSAYELEIYDQADNSLDVDTGKVASATSSRTVTGATLTNGKSYRWRVRTWDAADEVSDWSTYGTFSTSAGGTVTITDPSTDNPAGVITDDYEIDWSVSGTTQASYRVKLIRTDTSATISDTGWVASVATTYNVTGMLSGIEYRVEVTVRNAGLVESGTGTRLITPDYGDPETPVLSLSTFPSDGYVLIGVDNPTPTGDRPEVTYNLILRRPVGELAYTVVGQCDPDGEFKDYTAAHGVEYEYVVRGVSV